MATLKDKYFEKMLETLVDHNDHHNAPFSNEKPLRAVSKFVAETEEEEHNANNVTMDTFCHSLVTTNTTRKNANIPNERRITSDILAEKLKVLKRLMLHSTINNSAYYNSDEDDAESDPKSDPLVATRTSDRKKRKFADTDTTKANYQQKLLINRTIPVIILPIDPPIVGGVAESIGTLHACQRIVSKKIGTDAACSGTRVLLDPTVVNRRDTYRTIPRDRNTSRSLPRLTSPVRIGGGTSVSPDRTESKEISSPCGPISPVKFRNSQPFHTSINGNSSEHRYPMPNFSKLIGRKLSENSSADVYARSQVNFTHDTVLAESPNFMNMGLSSVHRSDELGSFIIPSTIIIRPIDGYKCLPPVHLIFEVAASRMGRTRSEQKYSSKTDFETMRENQYLGRQNISMSRPPLDSIYFGTNTTNGIMSPIGSIPVGTKTPENIPQTLSTYLSTLPTDLPEQNGKVHVPGDPDLYPSSSDLSLENLICQMIASPVNQLKRNSIRRKIVRKTRNSTHQNRSMMILTRTVSTCTFC